MKHSQVELENLIVKFSDAYYNKSEPLITDHEFDELTEELKTSYPNSKLLLGEGWGYEPSSDHLVKFAHTADMRGYTRTKYVNMVNDPSWTYDQKFTASSKMDGASAVVYYENGKLKRVLSRGNSKEGFDITQNLRFLGLPKVVDPSIKWIRIEVLMSKSNNKKINGSHPRNSASGLSQSKYASEEELKMLEFRGLYTNLLYEKGSYLEDIKRLQGYGIKCPELFQINSIQEFRDRVLDIKAKLDSMDIPFDGLVLFSENSKQYDPLIFKFEDETARTKVVGITWQSTRTGRYVPVAELEPVPLEGAIITRSTLNNLGYLKSFEPALGVGSEVEIIRANMIIPQVVKTFNEGSLKLPEVCECCGSKLKIKVNEFSGSQDLVCDNPNCGLKTDKVMWNLFEKTRVDGIGNSTFKRFLDYHDVNSLKDLFEAAKQTQSLKTIYSLVTANKVQTVLENIVNYKPTVFDVLLIANVAKLGSTSADLLAKNVSIEEFKSNILNDTVPETWSQYCSSYPAFVSLKETVKRVHEILDVFPELSEYIVEEKKPTKLKYSMTGSFSKSRGEIEKEFSDLGFELVRPKEADVFLINVRKGSNKEKEAEANNIPFMTENEFRNKYVN